MPVVRGKKKTKRERRRFGSVAPAVSDDQIATAPAAAAKPVRRRGWQGPPWLNVLVGVIMVAGGVVFARLNKGGAVILIAYWVVGGFYLYQAYRQYRKKKLL